MKEYVKTFGNMLWLGLYTLTSLFMKSEYCNINSMEIRGKMDLSLEKWV